MQRDVFLFAYVMESTPVNVQSLDEECSHSVYVLSSVHVVDTASTTKQCEV